MSAALLDVNVLTALLWPDHEHHEKAHHWFHARSDRRWATCVLTELAFVRLTSNPAFSRKALSPAAALSLLAKNLAHPTHEIWTDNASITTTLETLHTRLQGHQQLTDAYLLALAHRHRGVLATFDHGARSLAGKELASSVEIVLTR